MKTVCDLLNLLDGQNHISTLTNQSQSTNCEEEKATNHNQCSKTTSGLPTKPGNDTSINTRRENLRNGLKTNSINTSSYGRKRKRKIIDGEVICYPSKTRREKYDRDNIKLKSLSFDWSDYLQSIDALPIPNNLFDDAFINCGFSINNNSNLFGINPPKFQINQKLEGVDPCNESFICVLSIAEVLGQRLRLHFDGYPDQFDFWVLSTSQLIFPVGWCKQTNRRLQPPKDYINCKEFIWSDYLTKTKAQSAPQESFAITNEIYPNNVSSRFVIGQKLEAVDKRNQCMICVATVCDVIGCNVLVHYDSWDSSYDMWAHCNSPLLQPVGYCEENERVLSVPASFGHDLSSFNWDSYLAMTNSTPVPRSSFENRPEWWLELDQGMRCELVDRRCPQLIRAAHIVKFDNEFQLTMAFDDWSEKYNVKIDLSCSWPIMFPIGWCVANNCVLQPPPTYDASIETSICSVYGCKGLGHIKGPKYSHHQRVSGCPYADCNFNKDMRTERLPPNPVECESPVNKSVSTEMAKKYPVQQIIELSEPLSIEIPNLQYSQHDYDNNKPMDLSMKSSLIPDLTDNATNTTLPASYAEPICLSIKQEEVIYIDRTVPDKTEVIKIELMQNADTEENEDNIIAEDSEIFDNPPGDFVLETSDTTNMESTIEYPTSLSLPPSITSKQPPEKSSNNTDHDNQKFFHQYQPPKNLIPNPVAIIPSSVLRPYTNRIPYHPSDEYRRIMEWNITEQILPQLKPIKQIYSTSSSSSVSSKKSTTQNSGVGTTKRKGRTRNKRFSDNNISTNNSNNNNHVIESSNPAPTNNSKSKPYLNGDKGGSVLKNNKEDENVFNWNPTQISHFVAQIIGTDQYSKAFIEQEVDGTAFLCLKQMDLMKVIGMRLGPAIKLATSIQYLRKCLGIPSNKIQTNVTNSSVTCSSNHNPS